ncbi:hypothetical protein BMR07_15615, partial [Methylococcaceae bacterium CS1]
MMARAIRGGINADFLLADAWFGTKPMLRSAEELSLTAIVRMKKSKLKYRITSHKNGNEVIQDLDLKALYKQAV